MMFTPKMLTDLAYFFTNTDRATLEKAGIIPEGKAGDERWKRYNSNFDIFILKCNQDQLEALVGLANRYAGYQADPTPAPIVEGKAAAFDRIVAAHQKHYDAVAAYNARLTVAEAERLRGSWAIKLDDEYHAMCKAQSDYHRVVREECVAALSATATEGK